MSRVIKDKVSWEWAQTLSKALKGWRQKHAVGKTDAQLAAELGLTYDLFRHLGRGDMVANDPKVYAWLYRLTNLPEARPWLVPPLMKTLPKRGFKPISRRMTEEAYQDWLEQLAAKTTTVKPKALHPREQTPGNFGAYFDRLLTELQATRLEMQRLRVILQPSLVTPDEVGELVEKLLTLENVAISGTKAARDAFFRRYGQEVALLLAASDALSDKDPEQREKKVARIRSFGALEVGDE